MAAAVLRHRRRPRRRRRDPDAGARRAARQAATLWSGRGRVFVGRDTRGSGPELEEAFARGVVAAGRQSPCSAGVLPTPAVALLALDLGVVISASHNPPEYNGVKFFDRDGQQAHRRAEEEIEALLDAPRGRGGGAGRPRRASPPTATSSTCSSASAPTSTGLRIARRLRERRLLRHRAARRSSGSAPRWSRSATRPNGDEHQRRLRRDRPARCCSAPSASAASTSASRSTATATACSPSTATATPVDGDQILAVLALAPRRRPRRRHRDDEPRLPPADGRARHPRRHAPTSATATCSRRSAARTGVLGGEQSGHVIYLRDHVTGDGLAAALPALRARSSGRTLAEAVAVMPRYPQVKENVRVARRELPQAVLDGGRATQRRARRRGPRARPRRPARSP